MLHQVSIHLIAKNRPFQVHFALVTSDPTPVAVIDELAQLTEEPALASRRDFAFSVIGTGHLILL